MSKDAVTRVARRTTVPGSLRVPLLLFFLLACAGTSPPRPSTKPDVSAAAGSPSNGGAEAPLRPFPLLPGASRAPPNAPVQWQYVVNLNALSASATVGAHLVAITEAGHLLVFETTSLRLVGQRLNQKKATCLGAAINGSVVVGFADGTIARTSVPELALTNVANVPGAVVWVGQRSSGALVAVHANADAASVSPTERRRVFTVKVLDPALEVQVLQASAFLLDNHERLWLASDHGEFGGTLQRVDLDSGDVIDLPGSAGIYGFVQMGEDVWTFGGTSHMGVLDALVTRVWPGKPITLYRRSVFAFGKPVDFKAKPTGPISHIVPQGDKLLVFSFNDVFDTDRKLRRWRWRQRVNAYATPGRPDAVGSYPAIKAVHSLEGRITLTTIRDGIIEVSDNGATSHELPGQLPVSAAGVIASHDELIVVGHGRDPYVALGKTGWAPARESLLPAPPTDVGTAPERWCAVRFIPTADGQLRIAARRGRPFDEARCAGYSENLVITGVRTHGEFREQTRQVTSLSPEMVYQLPNGNLAAVDHDNVLWTFARDGFLSTGIVLQSGQWQEYAVRDTLGSYGDGWLIRKGGTLAIVHFDPPGVARYVFLPSVPAISAALSIGPDAVLLATESGLCEYNVRSAACTKLSPSGLIGSTRALQRDDRGRIWMLGDRLYWLVSPVLAVPIPLPFLDGMDSGYRKPSLTVSGNRIFVALWERGLLAIDADRTARALQPAN